MSAIFKEYVLILCGVNLFLQPLKLATLNLVQNLGLGSSLPRNNFWWGSGLSQHPKNVRPPTYFCNCWS